jgi:hypothetical protein
MSKPGDAARKRDIELIRLLLLHYQSAPYFQPDMPFTPSEQEIAAILPHLRYEIDQIFVVPHHDKKDWRIRESVYLAMLVHARLLLDFFEHASRKYDDVLCEDFGFKPAPVPLSDSNRRRLNKDIAHLTYSRLRHTPETKTWPWEDILGPIRERAAEFLSHIINNPPQHSAAEELARWKGLHDQITQAGNKSLQPRVVLEISTDTSNTASQALRTIHLGGE